MSSGPWLQLRWGPHGSLFPVNIIHTSEPEKDLEFHARALRAANFKRIVHVSVEDAARAAKMREALEFYARESNWYKDQSAPNTPFFMRGEGGPSFAEKDRGERARKALGGGDE